MPVLIVTSGIALSYRHARNESQNEAQADLCKGTPDFMHLFRLIIASTISLTDGLPGRRCHNLNDPSFDTQLRCRKTTPATHHAPGPALTWLFNTKRRFSFGGLTVMAWKTLRLFREIWFTRLQRKS